MLSLDRAARLAGYHAPGSRTRAFLDLLRHWLEYRFETDVALADTRAAAAGSDDIGIAASQ